MKVLLVAVFGSLGALSRYGVSTAISTRNFPYATMAINIAGSFALGLVLTLASQRIRPDLATGLAVGFLGAFTTFSTLSWDSFSLLKDGRPVAALVNVLISVALGVGAASLGYVVGDHFITEQAGDVESFHVFDEGHPNQAFEVEHAPNGDVTN
jgi:CrcB protein